MDSNSVAAVVPVGVLPRKKMLKIVVLLIALVGCGQSSPMKDDQTAGLLAHSYLTRSNNSTSGKSG